MKSNWEIRPLGELVKFSSGGTPSKKNPDYWNGTIPWISAKTMKDERVSTSDLMITEEGLASGSKLAPIGSLLLLTRGSGLFNGIPLCIVEKPVAFNQDVKCIESCTDVSNKFIFYWLKSQEEYLRAKLEVTGIGAGKFDTKFLQELNVPIPCKEERDKIVSIAESISKKIIINTKINDNLQQQAFALFEKLLSGEHLEVCSLSEIADLNPKRSLTKNEMARCIDMAQLSTSGSFPNGWELKPYNGGMRFANGDTLLARITPCLENGKTAYIDFLDADEVAFGSTEYIVMCSQGQYPSEFFYCLARYPSFVDYAVKNMNGSSGRQRVSAETIGKYLLPRLTDDELTEFRDVVPALFSAMRLNSLENISLAELRDALLPKLMSGEIDVSDIQI